MPGNTVLESFILVCNRLIFLQVLTALTNVAATAIVNNQTLYIDGGDQRWITGNDNITIAASLSPKKKKSYLYLVQTLNCLFL